MLAPALSLVSFLPDWLEKWDYALFHKINGTWHTGVLDAVIPLLRDQYTWVPFYIFLILFVTFNFGIRGWLWVFIFIGIAIISDYTSSTLIKESLFRLRPCRNPDLAGNVRFIVAYCPFSSSFTSSHAVNHFTAAMYIFTTFKTLSRRWIYIFVWATVIIYAQVYVGVHFPVDVLAGTIVGLILGFIPAWLFNRYVKLCPPEELKKI